MIQRQLLSQLKQWSVSTDRKPLILRGARQTGKTTLVKEFGKLYDIFIYLNLEKPEDRKIFESGLSFTDLVASIFYYSRKKRSDHNVLIFIDEIQNSPSAVSSMRFFYEETPGIHVIAAGSLLESLIDKNISFPVGRVEYLYLRPCSFVEFMNAAGEDESLKFTEKSIPVYAHNNLTYLFNRYTLIGGMPEAVQKYTETGDMIVVNKTFRNLITGFSDDVEKYGRNSSMVQHIRHILKTGFFYAGQRIKFERFGSSDYRSREMGEAFRALEKALLIELVYPLTKSVIPVIPDFRKSPKLLWLDTGIVNFMAGIQKELFNIRDITSAWKGIIAEHMAGQELLTLDKGVSGKRCFWVREAKNSNAEIDFVFFYQGLLIPVEIKSAKGTRLISLHLYMETAPHDIAVRIWSSPFSINTVKTQNGKRFRLLNIPFYMIHRLPELLDSII